MEQTIYADILFAVNFSMDFLALYVTAFFLKIRFSLKRGSLAAFIGGAYGVIAVVYNIGLIGTVVCSAISGLIMCAILGGTLKLGLLAREMVVFLVSNLIIGGGMTAIYSFFNSFGAAQKLLIYGELESVEEQMPLALFAVGSAVVAVFVCIFGRIFDKRKGRTTVRLYVEYRGRSIECPGLADSGNLLTEPFSGLPVIILDKKRAGELLPLEILSLICEMKLTGKGIEATKIRFITCNTVAGRKSVGAFLPDKLRVNGIEASAWIAVADNGLERGAGDYSAIVPYGIVNL